MADLHPQTPLERRINAILGELVAAQRQLLRGSPADRKLLASNGASITYWQSKLRQYATNGRELPLESTAPKREVMQRASGGQCGPRIQRDPTSGGRE